ncbi:MAG: hypothetical protein WCT14_21710 [Treponemataceae bacterium]
MNFKKLLPFLTGLVVFASCGSMKLATITTPIQPQAVQELQGSNLAVVPPEVALVASRAEFDLRDVKIEINGQEIKLMGRFLEEINDMDLGKVGVLDTNIFKKAKVDTADLSAHFADLLIQRLDGAKDFQYPINVNIPTAGDYSSRPLVYDFSKFPQTSSFVPESKPLKPIFSSVAIGDAADYVLKAKVSVRSDIFEILNDDVYIQNKFISAPHKPSKGDYYLSLLAYMDFQLIDSKTGKIVMDQKTKQNMAITYVSRKTEYLPINKNDAAAYAKYFRTYDFAKNAKAVVGELATGIIPALRPIYSNINQYVKVEKTTTP